MVKWTKVNIFKCAPFLECEKRNYLVQLVGIGDHTSGCLKLKFKKNL